MWCHIICRGRYRIITYCVTRPLGETMSKGQEVSKLHWNVAKIIGLECCKLQNTLWSSAKPIQISKGRQRSKILYCLGLQLLLLHHCNFHSLAQANSKHIKMLHFQLTNPPCNATFPRVYDPLYLLYHSQYFNSAALRKQETTDHKSMRVQANEQIQHNTMNKFLLSLAVDKYITISSKFRRTILQTSGSWVSMKFPEATGKTQS